ncbi:MAG: Uma2 family endonuclease [Polyangiaceae bacterium]
MNEPAEKRATYADVLAAPPNRVAELVGGRLYTFPRPAAPHAHAASVLGMDIGSPFQRGRNGPGGWWILDEPELHFDDDVVVPDLGGWRRERMPTVPNVPHFTLPPDWLCEVLSPSTEAFDRADKLDVYARAHVSWVWLVNPLTHTLEVLRLREGAWTVHAIHRGDAVVRAEPFDAIELALSDLWLPSNESE